MPHYELDDYVQEHVPDDAVSTNCAASWRACADAEGRLASPFVNLHNSQVAKGLPTIASGVCQRR
jgi:hypothetical protein